MLTVIIIFKDKEIKWNFPEPTPNVGDLREFIKAQYVPWFSLLTGAMIDLMVSVLSSWKLIRNK